MSPALPPHATASRRAANGRPLADRLRGLLSLLVLLALLVGVPAALIALRGNPLPDAGLDPSALLGVLTRPDDGSLFLAALTWVAWLGWASFALSVLVEVPAQLRGLPSPHLPALGLQQRAAGALVAGATLLFTLPTALADPALAAAPPPATANMSASTAATTQASGATATTARSIPSPPAPSSAPTYTVQAGDSLWQIAADQLGDGARYPELARLNYGRPQPDGLTLTSDHWLRPGWTLLLPADAAAAAPSAAPAGAAGPGAGAVVVEPGDTLWDIAEQTLGDGARYGEIAAASTGTQPDGGRLTDPDLIRPGWHLTVPGQPPSAPRQPPPADLDAAHDVDEPPRLDEQSPAAPAGPQPTAEPPRAAGSTGRDTGSPADTPREPPSPTDQLDPTDEAVPDADQPDTDEDAPGVVRTAAGVGALLAAGLLALLGARRARQQRRRRPGQRIPMPGADLAAAETELRRVQDPDGLARVDQALRTLSVLLGHAGRPLPPLRLARLNAQHLELYLADPATLPAPFAGTADPTLWTVDADAALLPEADLTSVPAPYPSLVTLGHDLDDAHVLVDLEHLGALAVDGDSERSVAVLAALATELATSGWSDDLQVTLVGCLPSLPAALGTGLVRYLPTLQELLPALERRAAAVRTALAAHELEDLHYARTAAPDGGLPGDAWTPEIVLVAGPLDPAARARLDAVTLHFPAVGVAAVLAGDRAPSPWTLHLDADASSGFGGVAALEPVNLALRPQVLTAGDLDQLVGLLATAQQPATTPATDTGPGGDDEPQVRDLGRHLTDDDASTGSASAPVGETGVLRLVHLGRAPAGQTSGADDPASDDPVLPAVSSPASADDDLPAAVPAPLVQVLGRVEVRHARGEVEPSKRRQLTEIAAFLALNPGADHHGLSEAIWPGARALDNTRNTALSKLRRWLGTDQDGNDYVPRVLDDGYRLHPDVRTDWHLWQELLPAGPQQASTETLAAALELVRDKPFAGTNPRRYAWAERDRQDMISAIVDVAHELARRALLDGDAPLARRAAAAGLQTDPGAELLWRDVLKAEWLAGDRPSLVGTADRLSALADDLGDDLEPETVALLEELLQRPHKNVEAR
jgi:nucleoid-associated protein YgaU